MYSTGKLSFENVLHNWWKLPMHIRIALASQGIKAELLKDDNKLFDGLLNCNWVRAIFSKLLQISSEKLKCKLFWSWYTVIISSYSVTVTHYQSLSWHEENAVQLSMNSVHEEHIWPSNNLQKMQVGKSAITFCCNTFNGTLSQLFLSWEMSSFHLGISVLMIIIQTIS